MKAWSWLNVDKRVQGGGNKDGARSGEGRQAVSRGGCRAGTGTALRQELSCQVSRWSCRTVSPKSRRALVHLPPQCRQQVGVGMAARVPFCPLSKAGWGAGGWAPGVEGREGSGHSLGVLNKAPALLWAREWGWGWGACLEERLEVKMCWVKVAKSAERRHEKPLRGEARKPETWAGSLRACLVPWNSLQRLRCRAVPETEGQGSFPPAGTFQAKPGCCSWPGRLGLAWNQTSLQKGLLFLQGQRDASKDDSVVKASLS